jgi:hypothetical protein
MALALWQLTSRFGLSSLQSEANILHFHELKKKQDSPGILQETLLRIYTKPQI